MREEYTTRQYERGNILISALLILLVMNLLGIGLVQASIRESRTATYETIDDSVFHVTETCTRDGIDWLEGQTRPPENVPFVINQDDLDFMLVGDETQQILNKLSGYSYGCTVSYLLSKSESASDTSAGQEVGVSDSYGSAGDTSPKYYYQIDATGQGPQNAQKRIIAVVSVQF